MKALTGALAIVIGAAVLIEALDGKFNLGATIAAIFFLAARWHLAERDKKAKSPPDPPVVS